MRAPGDVDDGTDVRPLPSLNGPIPTLLCAAGVVMTGVGALAWIAVVTGADGIAWPVRVLAALALAVGVFTVLVGIGLFRARNAMRAADADAELDARLTAVVDAHGATQAGHDACAPGTACAGCDASCALNVLRS